MVEALRAAWRSNRPSRMKVRPGRRRETVRFIGLSGRSRRCGASRKSKRRAGAAAMSSEAVPRTDEACGAPPGARASICLRQMTRPTFARMDNGGPAARLVHSRAPGPGGQDARVPRDASRNTWINCRDDGGTAFDPRPACRSIALSSRQQQLRFRLRPRLPRRAVPAVPVYTRGKRFRPPEYFPSENHSPIPLLPAPVRFPRDSPTS